MATRPNLVLICIDDLGARDVGFAGSTFYETPEIDRFSSQGVTFTSAYSGSAMCSPSRASLMTGCTPARVGVTNWIGSPSVAGPLDAVGFSDGLPDRPTVASVLRDSGYQTWHVGKWHLGGGDSGPLGRGFDDCFSGANVGGPVRYFAPYLTPGLPRAPRGEYLIDRVTDEAIARVRNRDQDRPFFLNLWHFGVHTPIQAPPRLVAKYVEKRRSLGLGPSVSGVEDLDDGDELRFGRFPEARLIRRQRQSDPTFAAMIEALDGNVGRFLDALRAEGLDDDTVVAFTSDNGGVSSAWHFVPPGCNSPLREGKGWTCEGGIRVPMAIRWPGQIPAGSSSDVPVIGMDLVPTFLRAAGIEPDTDAHPDGRDLLPLVRVDPPGDTAFVDRDLFWHYPHYQGHGGRPACAIRSGRWKLIHWFEGTRDELFDLEADQAEQHDLADENPEVVADLRRRIAAWLADVDAQVPEVNPRWPRHGRSRSTLGRAAAVVWSYQVRRRWERRTARLARRA